MRLIDADALCMHLSDWQFGSMTDGKHNAEYEVINKVIDGIEQEPTVDAVQVVRCKDCKHYRELGRATGICAINDIEHRLFADWYCADGKRINE